MGKSNIIYYNDIEADRKIPTRSVPLKEVELPVDKDINPDDVEDVATVGGSRRISEHLDDPVDPLQEQGHDHLAERLEDHADRREDGDIPIRFQILEKLFHSGLLRV